jgi:ribonuclease P protein component
MVNESISGGEVARLSPSPVVGRANVPGRLKTRPLFRDASAGPRFSTDGFTMQRRLPQPGERLAQTRFGFTVTKKVGNAVVRNRIRRRLRAAVGAASAQLPHDPLDLVLVARIAALSIAFPDLVAAVIRAAAKLALRDRPSKPRSPA